MHKHWEDFQRAMQERLALWGQDVEVAIPDADDSSHWLTKTLRQVQPYYWRNAVDDNDI